MTNRKNQMSDGDKVTNSHEALFNAFCEVAPNHFDRGRKHLFAIEIINSLDEQGFQIVPKIYDGIKS